MAVDLSGGLELACDFFLAERPENPETRDSASLWVLDERGALAFPRVTVDAIGSKWDRAAVQLNLVLADGRAFRVWDEFPAHSRNGPHGKGTILGAGPLRFECVEPFHRWAMEFDGKAEQSTTQAQMAGQPSGTEVSLAFRMEATMAAPPWLMGGMTAEAAGLMKTSVESKLMGGLRYEQLARISGTVSVAGQEHRIAGTGMRVRRQGGRNMAAATGHCQHSALFPSGRAFGAIAFAPRKDGSLSFNEGFVFTGEGRPHPARVVQAPWMTRLATTGDDVSLVLESDIGSIRIEGESLLSTFDHHLFEMADVAVLHQGAARYVWDGEETVGLVERCTLKTQMADQAT